MNACGIQKKPTGWRFEQAEWSPGHGRVRAIQGKLATNLIEQGATNAANET
jgi:hypothetical protein